MDTLSSGIRWQTSQLDSKYLEATVHLPEADRAAMLDIDVDDGTLLLQAPGGTDTIQLPEGVDADLISCSFDKATRILMLKVPKVCSLEKRIGEHSHPACSSTSTPHCNEGLKKGKAQSYSSNMYSDHDTRQLRVRAEFNEAFHPTRIVPLVRTPDAMVKRILQTAQLSSADHLCDLGSGDGRVVIIAAQEFGAQASGLEITSTLVQESATRAMECGVQSKTSFHAVDMFALDPAHELLARATVLFMHLMPEPVQRLRPHIEAALDRGARVVTLNYHLLGAPIWAQDRMCPALVYRKVDGEEPLGYVTEKQAKLEVSDQIKSQRQRLAGSTGKRDE